MSVEHSAAIICAWMISYFVHSTVLLGGAWLATRKLSSRFDRLSEVAWRIAIVLPVVTMMVRPLVTISARGLNPSLEYAPPAMTVSAVPSLLWLVAAGLWIATTSAGVTQLLLLERLLRRGF